MKTLVPDILPNSMQGVYQVMLIDGIGAVIWVLKTTFGDGAGFL